MSAFTPFVQDLGESKYRLAWLMIPVGICASVIVLGMTGINIDAKSIFPFIILIFLLLSCHYYYQCRKPNLRLALVSGSVGIMILSALLAGIISNAGMRLRFPLIDETLAAVDFAMGIDTPNVVRALANFPEFSKLLGLAYSSIFPLSFLSAIWFSLRGESKRLWELVLGFGVCLQIAAIISVFLPALGNISYAGLGGLANTSLPEGSGIYHLQAVEAYRNGIRPILDVGKLEGVVTFPSFHIIMAIIVAYAFRRMGLITWLILLWSALVILSTIPIGGHYVIDLLAGTALWLACISAARYNVMAMPIFQSRNKPQPETYGTWGLSTFRQVPERLQN